MTSYLQQHQLFSHHALENVTQSDPDPKEDPVDLGQNVTPSFFIRAGDNHIFINNSQQLLIYLISQKKEEEHVDGGPINV